MSTVCCNCSGPFDYVLKRKYRTWCDSCLDEKLHRERPEFG
jgi:hypothetical protein